MGKSVTAEILAKHGVPVIDSDDLAREVVKPGCWAYEKIVHRYGKTAVLEDQTLDRSFIAQKVFSNVDEKNWIESIIHPEIRALRNKKMNQLQESNHAPDSRSSLVAWIVPLLFENGMECEVNLTVCVASSQSTQLMRLKGRNWTQREINLRLQNQWPVERKASNANFVIWNEFNLDILEKQIILVLNEIQ